MSNNDFLVTIVLISDNSEKTIKTAINNIIKQTFKSFELIIIDNCSKDKTNSFLDILAFKEYFKNLRIIRMIKKQNLSFLKNYGISIAEGDYITFLTAQDIISSTFIENLMKPLRVSKTQKYKPLVLTNFSTKNHSNLSKNSFELLSIGNLKEIILLPELFKYTQGKMYQLNSIKNFNLLFNEKLLEIEASFLFSLQYLLISDEMIKIEHEAIISSVFVNKNKILIDTSKTKNEFNIEHLMYIFIKLLETIQQHKEYLAHLKLLKSLFIHFIKPFCLIKIEKDNSLYTEKFKNLLNKVDKLINNSKLGKSIIDTINSSVFNINNIKYSVVLLTQDLNKKPCISPTETLNTLITDLKNQNTQYIFIVKDKTLLSKDFINQMLILSISYNKNICILPIKERPIKEDNSFISQEYSQQNNIYLSKETTKEFSLNSELSNFENSFIFINDFSKLSKIDFIQSTLVKDKIY